MEEFLFVKQISKTKSLCIGPITRRESESIEDLALASGTGFYLFLVDTGAAEQPVAVLAKVCSYEAACGLAEIMRGGQVALAA